MLFKINDPDCKHNQGFVLNTHSGYEGWWCFCGCGFRINFDPEHFLESIAIVKKKVVLQPPLVSSKS